MSVHACGGTDIIYMKFVFFDFNLEKYTMRAWEYGVQRVVRSRKGFRVCVCVCVFFFKKKIFIY